MPFGSLDHFITHREDFFVRCHFPIPEISRAQWRLRVSGLVARSPELGWDELRSLPTTSLTATNECAGNGRVFLSSKIDGAQWERGAVGNAVWTGVPLKTILERAGLEPGASEVILVSSTKCLAST